MIAKILLLAVTVGGLIVFASIAWMQSHPSAPPVPKQMILVAATALEAGSLLKPDDIGSTEVSASETDGALADTPENRGELRGSMIRRGLAAGERLKSSLVIHPADHGFLAAVLDPGMRAMPISLGQIASDANLLWPGDRVDVLLVRDDTQGQRSAAYSVSGEMVLTNVRVLAIDQSLIQGALPGAATAQPARSITLEVAPNDVARLAVALRLGKLILTVRSTNTAASNGHLAPSPGSPHQIVWAGDVSKASAVAVARTAIPSVVRILRGAQINLERF